MWMDQLTKLISIGILTFLLLFLFILFRYEVMVA